MNKTCVIIRNVYNPQTVPVSEEIAGFLAAAGVSSTFRDFSGNGDGGLLDAAGFVVTLGGDGTVLFASRLCAPRGIPVFPVNFGEFGFIAGISKDNWKEPLADWLSGKLSYTGRTMLAGGVFHSGGSESGAAAYRSLALNDVVIKNTGVSHIVELSVSADNEPFGNFRADGIIVSTPTGSTAYSAAAGGPIVDPRLPALLVTPINAFSLSGRPIVLPESSTLTITVLPSRGAGSMVTFDGQNSFALAEGDTVTITAAKDKIRLIGCGEAVFYNALRSKMHWRADMAPEDAG